MPANLDCFEDSNSSRSFAQLPLGSRKLLAMYYYENLPTSWIAACFNLPACRVDEILTQTVGLLRNDLFGCISRKFAPDE
jgi:hypothetical protein